MAGRVFTLLPHWALELEVHLGIRDCRLSIMPENCYAVRVSGFVGDEYRYVDIDEYEFNHCTDFVQLAADHWRLAFNSLPPPVAVPVPVPAAVPINHDMPWWTPFALVGAACFMAVVCASVWLRDRWLDLRGKK